MTGMVEVASLIRSAGPSAQRCGFAAGDFRVAKREPSTRQFCSSNCANSVSALPKTTVITSLWPIWPLPTYQEMLFMR